MTVVVVTVVTVVVTVVVASPLTGTPTTGGSALELPAVLSLEARLKPGDPPRCVAAAAAAFPFFTGGRTAVGAVLRCGVVEVEGSAASLGPALRQDLSGGGKGLSGGFERSCCVSVLLGRPQARGVVSLGVNETRRPLNRKAGALAVPLLLRLVSVLLLLRCESPALGLLSVGIVGVTSFLTALPRESKAAILASASARLADGAMVIVRSSASALHAVQVMDCLWMRRTSRVGVLCVCKFVVTDLLLLLLKYRSPAMTIP